MSIEKSNKLETYKGIKKRKNGLEEVFRKLQFNKKKPKHHYWSGLIAGILVRDLQFLQPLLESKNKRDKEPLDKILESVIRSASTLVDEYNWKMYDLNELANQFFSDD